MPPAIRPFTPPVVTPPTTPAARPAADARAAQRAFFQQVIGDQTPVRAAPQVERPVRAAAPMAAPVVRDRIRPIPEDKPDRIMRPGSFVDIKV
jgi:hypothetical protein